MAADTHGLTRKATTLPDRYTRGFPWAMDQRCQAAKEVATDLVRLWQDLGGVESLSTQQGWLVERVVFLHRQMVAYETAVLNGTAPPMSAGEYSNFANVAVGHLKALGLERKARPVDLATYLKGRTSAKSEPIEASDAK